VKSTLETLEDNKVKLLVDIEEAEFEKDLDQAFKRISKEIKMPGFREGKVPRKVLEAKIGQQHARDEAFRSALPGYYTKAVREHEVDVIAPPEFDIKSGQEEGEVTFEAVVEVRPSIEVQGYGSIEVEVSTLDVADKDIDEVIDMVRKQTSELETVDRKSKYGDRVSIDIDTTHKDEPVPGFTTQAYSYELGSAAVLPEMDENLTGVKAGDEVSFDAKHPDEAETDPLRITIKVNEVQETILPEITPEWVKDNSEFETIEELRADYLQRMVKERKTKANMDCRTKVSEQIASLVEDEQVPKALVDSEVENRLQDMAMRLQAQGIAFDQYLELTGSSQEQMLEEVKVTAESGAKLDLALRSIALRENLEVTDAEMEEEYSKVAVQIKKTTEEVKQEFIDAGQVKALKMDVLKSNTLDWLIESAKVVDENGKELTASDLEIVEDSAETPK